MRRGSVVRLIVIALLTAVAVTLVAVLIRWLPVSASEEMDRITFVYWFATVICIAIFSIVVALILYSVFAFRAKPEDDADGLPIHGNTKLEVIWTAVPFLLVVSIGVVSAVVLSRNSDAGTNPLPVTVTAQQFAWSFEYPEQDDLVTGELVLPIGRAVEFDLVTKDVIHSFWVPEFGQKQDIVPGIHTGIVVTPTREGTFELICTELCGLGHATMRSTVHVVSAETFDEWVAEQQTPPDTGEALGASVFTEQGCGSCHAFAPAGSTAEVGPPLDDLTAAAEAAGVPLEEYVRESIVDPNAVVADGYQAGVMPASYGDTLSAEQLDALVAYLTGTEE